MAVELPTVAEVRAIIETTFSDAQITVIIGHAALMVGSCVAGYSAELQETIIAYVAAHIIASIGGLSSGGSGGAITAQSLGDASESYATATMGEGLRGTQYGKMAMMLDPSGCIASLGQLPTKFEVL